jgi:hypothetical protein
VTRAGARLSGREVAVHQDGPKGQKNENKSVNNRRAPREHGPN